MAMISKSTGAGDTSTSDARGEVRLSMSRLLFPGGALLLGTPPSRLFISSASTDSRR